MLCKRDFHTEEELGECDHWGLEYGVYVALRVLNQYTLTLCAEPGKGAMCRLARICKRRC